WHGRAVTSTFLDALQLRRGLQANLILSRFSTIFAEGPALDYGCGQGIFVRKAIDAGMDCYGADLNTSEASKHIPQGRLVRVESPWALPTGDVAFRTLLLLDVLEHSPTPVDFLNMISVRRIQHLMIKIPLVTGPIAKASLFLTRLGNPKMLERLLLA